MKATARKTSAGARDLSAAVAQVHARAHRNAGSADLDDPATISDNLLLAAGDSPSRDTFFDLDDTHKPVVLLKHPVHIMLGQRARLPDYRTREGKRNQCTLIIIPPKVRESIRHCFGVETNAEYPITTALIALADYGAMVLRRDGKRLMVEGALDPLANERKAARKTIRQANRK